MNDQAPRAGGSPLRFSVLILPGHPVRELLDAIRLADELGFHACYLADEIYHKDLWQLLAVAATTTTRIRLGPNATHVILKDPTLIAQQLATLDELSGGRAEGVVSLGNGAMLRQYGIEWGRGAIRRMREAHHVIRTLLDTGEITFAGEFYRYDGVFTQARPVQPRLPLMLGGMRGPLSFRLAAEVSDGFHHGAAHARAALDYAFEQVQVGAARGGRDPRSLDLATVVEFAVAEDARVAREAARVTAAFYLSAMPPELIERHGVAAADAEPILRALARGDAEGAVGLMSPELAARLSIAGSPEDCVAQLEREVAGSGFDHVVLVVTDPHVIAGLTGRAIAGVPDLAQQIRLVHERVMPAFA